MASRTRNTSIDTQETLIPDDTPERAHTFTHIRGVEGDSLYLNNYRIAGPKPWGGGTIVKEWTVTEKDVLEGMKHDQ